MSGFLSKFFGGGSSSKPKTEQKEVYKDFEIIADPIAEGGQWRLAGRIRKAGGNGAERKFIRSDIFSDAETAGQFALQKGRLIIDQQGSRIFTDYPDGAIL